MADIVFKLELAGPVCIPGLSEDAVRELFNAARFVIDSGDLDGLVTSSRATRTHFGHDATGNFSGVTEIINGQFSQIIPGLGSDQLGMWSGQPTATKPGPGWEVDPVASQQVFAQSSDQSTWTYFIARRVGILNTVSP